MTKEEIEKLARESFKQEPLPLDDYFPKTHTPKQLREAYVAGFEAGYHQGIKDEYEETKEKIK